MDQISVRIRGEIVSLIAVSVIYLRNEAISSQITWDLKRKGSAGL